MKIEAEVFNIENDFITLKTNYKHDLQINKVYNIDFKEYKSKRSIEQNKLMWEIINRIAKETNNDEWEIYCLGLEKANCKSEYLMILPEAYETIKKTFRAAKICEHREYNGKDMLVIKVFVGSSKCNVNEMNDLIDYFIRVASDLCVYIKDIL